MERSEGRTAVYWLYDDREVLLYVGLARDPRSRWRQHKSTKEWWPRVSTRTVEWFDSLADAKRVESESIATDLPIHNSMEAVVMGDAVDGLDWVNLMQAKDCLHTMVDAVAAGGEPKVIARRGKPLAILMSYEQVKRGVPQ